MKTKIIFKTIAIILLSVLVLSFFARLTNIDFFGSSGNSKPSNKPTPEEPFVPSEFGGHTALYMDFTDKYTADGNWYKSETINPYTETNQNLYLASNNGINVSVTSGENGSVVFSHTSEDVYDTSKVSDPYAILDNRVFSTYDKKINYLDSRVSDYKCITLDIDVDLGENFTDHTLTIRPLWRDVNNKIIYRSTVNGIGFCPFRVKDGYYVQKDGYSYSHDIANNKFHLTIVVRELYTDYITCEYYVDGSYFMSTEQNSQNIIPNEAVKLTGLRVGISGDTSSESEFSVSVDNLVINYFDKDYSGDIDRLLNSENEDLYKNSDTVLGQNNNEIFKNNFLNKGSNLPPEDKERGEEE